MRNVLIIAMLGLSGCGTSTNSPAAQQEYMREQAVARLKADLKDPASIQTRNDFMSRASGASSLATVYCGEVNSKNSFGGYDGFSRFIAPATDTVPVVIEGENMDGDEFAKTWALMCSEPAA